MKLRNGHIKTEHNADAFCARFMILLYEQRLYYKYKIEKNVWVKSCFYNKYYKLKTSEIRLMIVTIVYSVPIEQDSLPQRQPTPMKWTRKVNVCKNLQWTDV